VTPYMPWNAQANTNLILDVSTKQEPQIEMNRFALHVHGEEVIKQFEFMIIIII